MAEHWPLRGLALYALAVGLFASMDTISKVLTATHASPVPLVAAARYWVQLVPMTALLWPRHGRELVSPSRPVPVLLRSLCLVGATLFTGAALIARPTGNWTPWACRSRWAARPSTP